jgi:hypothetical protein
MTFAQRERKERERLARHSARNQARLAALTDEEKVALTQKADALRVALLGKPAQQEA